MTQKGSNCYTTCVPLEISIPARPAVSRRWPFSPAPKMTQKRLNCYTTRILLQTSVTARPAINGPLSCRENDPEGLKPLHNGKTISDLQGQWPSLLPLK